MPRYERHTPLISADFPRAKQLDLHVIIMPLLETAQMIVTNSLEVLEDRLDEVRTCPVGAAHILRSRLEPLDGGRVSCSL